MLMASQNRKAWLFPVTESPYARCLIREQVPGPALSSVLGQEPKPLLQRALRQWLLCYLFSRNVSGESILVFFLPYSSCFLLVCIALLLC